MSDKSVAKSNPFDDLEGLLKALAKAPQDKQGAFRVATWRMVIEEVLKIKEQVGNTAVVAARAESAANTLPDINKIRQDIESSLQEKISAEDADTILF